MLTNLAECQLLIYRFVSVLTALFDNLSSGNNIFNLYIFKIIIFIPSNCFHLTNFLVEKAYMSSVFENIVRNAGSIWRFYVLRLCTYLNYTPNELLSSMKLPRFLLRFKLYFFLSSIAEVRKRPRPGEFRPIKPVLLRPFLWRAGSSPWRVFRTVSAFVCGRQGLNYRRALRSTSPILIIHFRIRGRDCESNSFALSRVVQMHCGGPTSKWKKLHRCIHCGCSFIKTLSEARWTSIIFIYLFIRLLIYLFYGTLKRFDTPWKRNIEPTFFRSTSSKCKVKNSILNWLGKVWKMNFHVICANAYDSKRCG